MPRGLDATWLTEAAKHTVRPFMTVRAFFDSGTRRLWDGPRTRNMLGGLDWEGGALMSISRIGLRAEAGATRVEVVVSGLDPTNLAVALGENFYGRRCEIGRGFFAADGTVAVHEVVFDGIIVNVRVNHQEDNSITWRTIVEVGTSRGRQAVGRRRTQSDQKTYARYLRNDQAFNDYGFRFVTGLRKPTVWPAQNWQPPDLRPDL